MLKLKKLLCSGNIQHNERVIIEKRVPDSGDYIEVFDNMSSHITYPTYKYVLKHTVVDEFRICYNVIPKHNHIEDVGVWEPSTTAICIKVHDINIRDFIPSINIRSIWSKIVHFSKKLINKYYTTDCYGEYCDLIGSFNSYDINGLVQQYKVSGNTSMLNIFNSIMIYPYQLRKGKYRKPIFRVNVIHYIDDLYELTDYTDTTMVFTLERHPKQLTSYDTMARRLNGNILPRNVINEVVKFVGDNYLVFVEAWFTDTRALNTYKHGYNPSDIDISNVDFSVFSCIDQ